MQLATFLAPPLKTMDSILQVGRESLGLTDSGHVLDLHYRVVRVRLWGTTTHFDGVQLVYRHCITDEIRESDVTKTAVCAATTPPQVEIDLLEEEFIVDVRGICAHSGASIVTTLVLITSTGRQFQAGTTVSDVSGITAGNSARSEVREVLCQLAPSGDAFVCVRPSTAAQPSTRAIQATVEEAIQVSTSKWWYPDRCEQLVVMLREVGKAVDGVVGRGVVYPVGILCEFGEVAQLGKAVIESCGQPLSVDYFVPRGPVIDGYIQRLSVLKEWTQDRIAKAELTILETASPVEPLDNQSVPRMIRQALKKDRRPIALALWCKYAEFVVTDESLLHKMVELLIETEDCGRIVDVVEAYAQAAKVPVGTLMARYKTRQPSLVERAVYREQTHLLEWLVREAMFDPFGEHAQPGRQKLTHAIATEEPTDEVDPVRRISQRQMKAETLFELVDGVKDPDAQKRMHSLLTHLKKKDDFQDGLLALASEDQPTAQEFHDLVSHVTSVYDLPLLFSQAQSCLQDDKRGLTVLIRATCEHILENKLVLDTMASAFFNVALRQASEHGYLTPLEYEHYRILNSQINMETAAWVIDLKRTTDHVQWRVDRLDNQLESLQRNVQDLRESLRRNEEIELNRRRCRRNWALVSSMLVMVGGGQAVYALQDMFEPVDPTLLISANHSDFMGDMKQAASGLLAGATDVNSLITRLTSTNSLLGDQPEHEPDGPTGMTVLRGLGVDDSKTAEIVNMLSTAAELCNLKPAIQQKRVRFDERQIRQHPYHNAVRESQGDLQQFKALERTLPPGADVNDEFEITVTKVHDDGASTTKTSRMPAYLYASHMGFVEIVEHLLTNKSLRKREWKLTTKRRARRAQSSLSTVSTVASVVRRLSASVSTPVSHSQ